MSLQLYIKTGSRYKPASRAIVTEIAGDYMDYDINGVAFTDPSYVKKFLIARMQKLEREFFGVVFLNSQHHVIEYKIMFQGTIDQGAVYPREVVKHALALNSAAVILCHNHPSGHSSPSDADRQITMVLKEALNMVDVRTLDHIVVGRETCSSFAEMGYL